MYTIKIDCYSKTKTQSLYYSSMIVITGGIRIVRGESGENHKTNDLQWVDGVSSYMHALEACRGL